MTQSAVQFSGARSPAKRPVVLFGSNQGLVWPAPKLMGSTFFVNGETGSDTGLGLPGRPFATIQAALDRAEPGMSIIVAPTADGYVENLVVATPYVSLIAAAVTGYGRPDIVPATGLALHVTTGQGFSARGFRFVSTNTDSVLQNANGFYYGDCVFDGGAAAHAALRLVGGTDDSYTASEGLVENSLFRGSSGAGIIFQHAPNPSGVGVSDNVIRDCRFYDNAVDLLSAVNTSGGGAGIFLNLLIDRPHFMTVGASYVYGDMDQGASGDLAANSMQISDPRFNDEALIASQFDISGQPKCMIVGCMTTAGLVDTSAFNN